MNKWIRVSLGNNPQAHWFALIKLTYWELWEAYMMNESFENHFHTCFHLHLAISISIRSPRSLRSYDCSSYKTKDVSDIFLCFWLVKKWENQWYTIQACLVISNHLQEVPPKGKGNQDAYDPWGYAMQCYNAMRDLRDKIGVLHPEEKSSPWKN